MAPQGAIFLRKHIRPSCGAGEKCSQWNEIVFFRHCKERSDASNGLLRGACHRRRIRATRWLAMTDFSTAKPLCKDDVSSPLIPAGGETGVHKALVFRQRRDGLPVLIVAL